MQADNLREKTRKGFAWSAIESFSGQGFQFLFSIVLARLLSPDVFGIIGMLAIFMALSDSLIDGGFGNALMQKSDRDQADYSTVFYINLLISVCIYGIMFLAAPFIADFYDMPVLEDVTRVISIRFILSGLIIVQITKLTIELDFKKLTKIRVTALILSGIVGVVLAYKGFGVWSLVGQSLANYFFQFVLIWSFSHWLPSLCFSKESFRKLFKFGSKLMVTCLYGQFFENINSLVIGKFYNPYLLGYYTRAHSLALLPSSSITSVIYRVSFPVLCNIQDDDSRLSQAIHKLIKHTYFVVFPIMGGLLVVADPLVDVLLTSKWARCVPYMQILCISMSLYPICAYNIDALLVKGLSGLHLKLDLVKRIFVLAVLSVTAFISVRAICFGSILIGLSSWLLTGFYAKKLLDLKIKDQMLDMMPSFLISILMMLTVFPLSLLNISSFILLIIQILTGAIVYLTLSYYFNRSSMLQLIEMVKR